MGDKPTFEEIVRGCDRFLTHHYRKSPRQTLAELAEFAGEQDADTYGAGELIAGFESELAALLGKEAVVFMPSGTMAQQIALRIWSQRKHSRYVAFHPRCHLEIHEHKGYQLLHGLHGVLVKAPDRLMKLDDLKPIVDPLAALLIELPQREIGGWLPEWDELSAQIAWAHERGAAVHMDGARLWESGPFYQKSYAEICAPFDSVYVSFYKGLGGISGAALAGPADFIAEARVWLRRHGGNLRSLYPYVLSARKGLQERLGRMEAYHRKALEAAAVLAQFPELDVTPNPPHTNMMHVYLRGERQRLEQAALEIARERKVFLFYQLAATTLPARWMFEWTVGDASLDFSAAEIGELFTELLRKAK